MADTAGAIADPIQVLDLLRAGDRLARCMATGWRLLQADRTVAPDAVGVLRRGYLWIGEDGALVDFGGGRLAPQGDALLPGFPAQTWAWVEGRGRAAAPART